MSVWGFKREDNFEYISPISLEIILLIFRYPPHYMPLTREMDTAREIFGTVVAPFHLYELSFCVRLCRPVCGLVFYASTRPHHKQGPFGEVRVGPYVVGAL